MGVPMPTFPDAVPGIPKGGSLPTTAASSGSATALRRPWRNRKAANDMRKCQRAHRKGFLVSTHSRCPMSTRRSAPAHSRSALKARPRDALPTQVVTDSACPTYRTGPWAACRCARSGLGYRNTLLEGRLMRRRAA